SRRADSLNLVYRDAGGTVTSFSLAGRATVTLGREPERELVIAEALVSRLPATIEHVQGPFFLPDSKSANRTVLNGLRPTGPSAIMLRENDVIEIKSTSLVFTHDPVNARPPTETTIKNGHESRYDLGNLILDGVTAFRARSEAPQLAWDKTLARL